MNSGGRSRITLRFFVCTQASDTCRDSCNLSESGSIITNPAFQRNRLTHQSFRSTVSDSEVDPQQSARSSTACTSKSSISTGYRYHAGSMVTTICTPTSDSPRVYIFEGLFKLCAHLVYRWYFFFFY